MAAAKPIPFDWQAAQKIPAIRRWPLVLSEETLDLFVLRENFKFHRRLFAFRCLLQMRLADPLGRCLLGEPPKSDRLPEMPTIPHF